MCLQDSARIPSEKAKRLFRTDLTNNNELGELNAHLLMCNGIEEREPWIAFCRSANDKASLIIVNLLHILFLQEFTSNIFIFVYFGFL